MRNDPRERALEICLQQLEAGAAIDSLMEMYPHWADELRPLLQTAQAARRVAEIVAQSAGGDAYKEARMRSREEMLAAAGTRAKGRSPASQGRSPLSCLRWVLVILFLLALVGAGLFTNTLATRAIPGEKLYPVKLAFEEARLAITRSSAGRLALEQAFDDERRREVEALIRLSKSATISGQDFDVQFAGTLENRQPGNWQVGGIQVMVPDDARLVGQIQTGISVEVKGRLQSDGSLAASSIRPREFEITGSLQKIEGSLWTVDGVSFTTTADTALLGAEAGQPMAGVKARVKVFLLAGQGLQARLVELNPTGESPEIDDEIGGAPKADSAQTDSAQDQAQTTPVPSASPQGKLDVPSPLAIVETMIAPAETGIAASAQITGNNSLRMTGAPSATIELEETVEATVSATKSRPVPGGGSGGGEMQPRDGQQGNSSGGSIYQPGSPNQSGGNSENN